MMVLENATCLLEFDNETGALRRVLDRRADLDLITEQRLAESFRLLFPIEADDHNLATESNYVLGSAQRLTDAEGGTDHAVLRWLGPLRTSSGGTYDADVTLDVRLEDDAATFRLSVRNGGDSVLAEAWYPIIGGITGLGPSDARQDTRLFVPLVSGSGDTDAFRTFGTHIDLGTPIPERFYGYPSGNLSMPWADIYHPGLGRGFSLAALDTEPRQKVLHLDLSPGIAPGREHGDWPRADELDGLPLGVRVCWVMMPYAPPGRTYEGPPVVLRLHEGDWREPCRHYRAWFGAHFPVVEPRTSWMRSATAVQNSMFLLPEGNVNYRFRDIPQWAEDARRRGVSAVMISGWHVGGHDNGYPHYEPDHRLGTWEELEAGIAVCHALGLRVCFFVNIHPVVTDTAWYREELHRYMVRDRWGEVSPGVGWGMGTLGARMGYTTRRMSWASPSLPAYREIIVRQMRRLAEIGADGVHIDKLFALALDFHPDSGMSPDLASHAGTLRCVEEILEAGRAANPSFEVSVESYWDRVLSYTGATWWAATPQAALRFAFPEWAPSMGIHMAYAFALVNDCVRYGYQLLVGPGHWTASMSYLAARRLSAYVAEVTRIREELKETLYFGEFLDAAGLNVEGVGYPSIEYSVFRNRQTGQRASVLVNNTAVARTAVIAGFDGDRAGPVRLYAPDTPTTTASLPLTLEIPSERFVVVVEG